MILALKRAKMSSKMPKKARRAEKSQIVSNDSILPPNIIIGSKKIFAQLKINISGPQICNRICDEQSHMRNSQEGETRFVRTLRLRPRGSIGTVKTKKPRVPALKPFLPSLFMCGRGCFFLASDLCKMHFIYFIYLGDVVYGFIK